MSYQCIISEKFFLWKEDKMHPSHKSVGLGWTLMPPENSSDNDMTAKYRRVWR